MNDRPYFACLDLDFEWTAPQLKEFLRLWGLGFKLADIAKELNRDPDEVALLIIDLGRKGKLGHYPRHRKRPKPYKKIDVQKLHQLYMNPGLSMTQIAKYFGAGRRRCYQIITRERLKEPEKWPARGERRSKQ